MATRLGLLLAAGRLLSAVAGAARAGVRAPEEGVKAAYLFKFAPFVQWPPPAFESETDPLVVCVSGDDDFAALAQSAMASQRLGARAMETRRLARVEKGAHCHVLFVAAGAGQTVADALAAVKGAPVLTVTDAPAGAPAGVVNFVRSGPNIRFAIDDRAAAENGLTLSSKLLQLAVAVRRRP